MMPRFSMFPDEQIHETKTQMKHYFKIVQPPQSNQKKNNKKKKKAAIIGKLTGNHITFIILENMKT